LENAIRIDAIAHGAPFIETRIHGSDEFGAHAAVFGEVNASASFGDEIIKVIE
jgi:hypothetical protein